MKSLWDKLKTWWTVWRRFGVTPWRYEADLREVRRVADELRCKGG